MSDISDLDDTTHRVRPRWTWIALGVMILGLVLVGVGISVDSWWVAIIGLVVLLVGGGCALYGGFFYDIQGSVGSQVDMVRSGEELEGPDPGTRRTEAEVIEHVHRRYGKTSPEDG